MKIVIDIIVDILNTFLFFVFVKIPSYAKHFKMFLHTALFYNILAYLLMGFYALMQLKFTLMKNGLWHIPVWVGVAVIIIFYFHAFDGFRTVIEDYVFDKSIRTFFVFLITLLFIKSLSDSVLFYAFLISDHNDIAAFTWSDCFRWLF